MFATTVYDFASQCSARWGIGQPAAAARALALAGTLFLTGCAGDRASSHSAHVDATTENPGLADVPPRTGFLGDYSGLRKSKTYDNTWLDRSPEIERYKSFIIEPVKVYPKATIGGVLLDAESSALLSSDFRAALTNSIGGAYSVTDTPGAGVARVRAAVTEVAHYKPASSAAEAQMGGAAMELEVVDSLTGQRLLALIDSGSVSSYDRPPAPTRRFEHARITFQHWASRLMIRLGTYGDSESTS